jgi:hypothetical protein
MKTTTAGDISRTSHATLSFKALPASELNSSLLDFYLGLGFDARRARFGGAMSDDAIRRHCAALDPRTSLVLACAGPSELLAAIELHPLSADWEDTELALADRATTDRMTIIAHLLQLAAFAAGERGCHTFIVSHDVPEAALRELLRGMGRARRQDDTIRVELGDYASLRSRTAGRL